MPKIGSDSNKPPVSLSSDAVASGSAVTTAGSSFQARTVSTASRQQLISLLPATETANRSVYHLQARQH